MDGDGGAGSTERQFWDGFARYDPLWAILSDPSKTGRQWSLGDFLETGRREISLLMYQLHALGIEVARDAALDFGCGIGRLSQPLARYFSRVVGVDISPEMIRLAGEINALPDRVAYICNDRADLSLFPTGAFTFAYSNIVLQHVEPATAVAYLRELLRVVAPGGVVVFQLPSHPRPVEEQQAFSTPMPDAAYRAIVQVDGGLPPSAEPGSEIVLGVSVTNAGEHEWLQERHGPIRVGNHWLAGAGQAMLVQDDGRAPLPQVLQPGATCRVALTVNVPRDAGEYELQCDVVHEGITWFADRGSPTWCGRVVVAGGEAVETVAAVPSGTAVAARLILADMDRVEVPGPLPMHGVRREVVDGLIEAHGGALVHVEPDDRGGREWVGYRYFVRKARLGI